MAPSRWEQAAKALAGAEALQQEVAHLQEDLTRIRRCLEQRAAGLREVVQNLRRDDIAVTLSPTEIVERLLGEQEMR